MLVEGVGVGFAFYPVTIDDGNHPSVRAKVRKRLMDGSLFCQAAKIIDPDFFFTCKNVHV